MAFIIKAVMFCCVLISCTTTPKGKYGIQPGQLAFIPSRIAVLACRPWPKSSPFKLNPKTLISNDEMNSLCQAVDKFIIDGFRNQPYMRGLSPKVVDALLEKANLQGHNEKIPSLWHQNEDSCIYCTDPMSYYTESISKRETWVLWLNEFSGKVYRADAILLPMITYAHHGVINDRGLEKAYYRAGIVLLLIDTANGQLIWAGGRDAVVQKRKLISELSEPIIKPSQDDVIDRLLLNDIWQGFPGRQN
ncbi:MAG: hypothetical protein HRU19_03930 [Pseudobacteriovorax sp.]|nr:hypothetical protein [Pseudobacteriovorax sp.]